MGNLIWLPVIVILTKTCLRIENHFFHRTFYLEHPRPESNVHKIYIYAYQHLCFSMFPRNLFFTCKKGKRNLFFIVYALILFAITKNTLRFNSQSLLNSLISMFINPNGQYFSLSNKDAYGSTDQQSFLLVT